MINENIESVQRLNHDASIGSMMSAVRSDRNQKTLDRIKDPKLRTERSLQQLVIDIDDKVLKFSKHNVDTSKAPKKG